MDAKSSDLFSFQLKGPIRQISTASLFDHCERRARLEGGFC